MEEKPDWYHNDYTVECIDKCLSCVLTIARSIDEGKIKSGVAVVRPPGHHAAYNSGSGFCFVNNAVVAADYLIKESKYSRYAIIVLSFSLSLSIVAKLVRYKIWKKDERNMVE